MGLVFVRFIVDIPFEEDHCWLKEKEQDFITDLRQGLERGLDKSSWMCDISKGEVVKEMKMEEITATVEKQTGFIVTWEWDEVVAEYDPKSGQILIRKGGV